MHIDQQPLYLERAADASTGAGTKCRAAAIRRAGSRAPWPDDTGRQCRRFTDRRCAGRAARVRDAVMQDQLLAEGEAAVPAEVVRELQVAGLKGRLKYDRSIGQPVATHSAHSRESGNPGAIFLRWCNF